MTGNHLRRTLCTCLALVAVAGATAQADTIASWGFNEKAPGNPADVGVPGAIIDDSVVRPVVGHNGTVLGGDLFGTGVMPRYVAGATPYPPNSALRLTLQDWLDNTSYVGPNEDRVTVEHSPDFNIDLSSNTTYTIEAIIRAPDPMDIMDSGLYHGEREGYFEFPQWYDYTDNSVVGKPNSMNSGRWVLRLTHQGHPGLFLQDNTGNWSETMSNGTATGGLWHHVAAKIIGSPSPANRKVEYYIDGVKTDEAFLSALSGTISSPRPLMIGSWSDGIGERWSDQFIGDIDAVRISTGAVTFLPTPSNTVPTMNIVHTGSTDPNTEAHLRLCDRFSGDSANSSTWTASLGPPASGRLQEAANSAAYYRALLSPEQLQDPTGWTATCTMKLVASNKPWNECLAVEDGQSSWVMSFMDSTFTQGSGDQGAGVYKSGAYHRGFGAMDSYFEGVTELGNVDPTDGFHTYQMYYDPATDSANFYMDGQLLGTQTRAEAWSRDPDGYTSKCRFFFGDSYPVFVDHQYYVGDTASDAYWGDVNLQTGCHVVPEPSTLVLLAMGGLMLSIRRRRR